MSFVRTYQPSAAEKLQLSVIPTLLTQDAAAAYANSIIKLKTQFNDKMLKETLP